MNLPPLSPIGERILAAATQESADQGQHYLGVEHLFLALAEERGADLTTALTRQKIDLTNYLEMLRVRISSAESQFQGDDIGPTPRCREILKLASRIAARTDRGVVEPTHLLSAVLREGRSVPVRLLRAVGTDVAALEEALRSKPKKVQTPTPLLDKFGRDMTHLATRGRLSPIIGREREMDLVAQVLLRKNKNNPVLLGEAGVGKTAVVEGFAQRLVDPSCPEPLKNRRIIELSVGSLVAGTKYRGEFEERILGIAKEAAENPEIILFLDEIHTLVGAGATGRDALDASNILKPALARGELRCIGASTMAEYRRHIEPDPALERRFERILVDEPTPAEAVAILEHLRPYLESHHEVEISPQALKTAVDLTARHVLDRQLPDKALDALDQSCARMRLRRYTEAESRPPEEESIRVLEEDVASTVAQWTGIPLEKISGEAARSLLNLGDELKTRVFGQDPAVRAVTRTVLTAKAGLAEPERPLGVFFFTGPTGVGKTHLAKSLAEVLFGDAKRLVRIDMSEYMEEHSVSNLIGAPPGYVGHEREGVLISALRTHPHSIVLFDEVEKAHPRIFDLFLQVFDDGRLTGTHGKSADFTQSVIILTSNIDPRPERVTEVGFGASAVEPESDARDALLTRMRPELVNRIDEVVSFEALDGDALRRIVDQYITGIEDLMSARELALKLDDDVYGRLIELGTSQQYGARELRRAVDVHLRQPLATEILGHGEEIAGIRVSADGDELRFEAL
ncbi:MAG: ATP-dependent Clp protease ATP-binding subunit [bacterium]|nr:ATP-dependent Clp protease ATP-binding subunit [bacterium]